MGKIGRNDPCPCGSGLKFKKCCIDKMPASPPVSNRQPAATAAPPVSKSKMPAYDLFDDLDDDWLLEDARDHSTAEIVKVLREFGVKISVETFREQAKQFESAIDMTENWLDSSSVSTDEDDVESIRIAGCVLWERLASDVISPEYVGELMQYGYDISDEGDEELAESCRIWLQVWDHLKANATDDMKSSDDAGALCSGIYSVCEWAHDFETMLYEAGDVDPVFFQIRMDFCNEFCSRFPASDELILVNMKRAAAECHFSLGQIEAGEQAFEALIEEYPENEWGYIGWGDMYYMFRAEGVDEDIAKARRIYELGLKACPDEMDLTGRIEELDDIANG